MSKEIPFEKSFASHEKSKYWSDKNGELKPKDFFKSISKKFWFDCHNRHPNPYLISLDLNLLTSFFPSF